jgi:hypothetical protein
MIPTETDILTNERPSDFLMISYPKEVSHLALIINSTGSLLSLMSTMMGLSPNLKWQDSSDSS